MAQEELETPQEVVPETPEKHSLYAKLKGYYPDDEFDDDGTAMTAAEKRLGEDDTYKEETEALLQNISDAVDADPEFAQVVAFIGKGGTFREAVARFVDPEDLQSFEGDPDYDVMESAKQQRMADREGRQKHLSEVQSNSLESSAIVDQFASDNNLDEEATAGLLASVDQIVTDIINGKISQDFLAKILTADNNKGEVAEAAENGRIDGLNENIEIQKAKTETAMAGDGIASVSGASVMRESMAKSKADEMDDIIGNSQKSRKF